MGNTFFFSVHGSVVALAKWAEKEEQQEEKKKENQTPRKFNRLTKIVKHHHWQQERNRKKGNKNRWFFDIWIVRKLVSWTNEIWQLVSSLFRVDWNESSSSYILYAHFHSYGFFFVRFQFQMPISTCTDRPYTK